MNYVQSFLEIGNAYYIIVPKSQNSGVIVPKDTN